MQFPEPGTSHHEWEEAPSTSHPHPKWVISGRLAQAMTSCQARHLHVTLTWVGGSERHMPLIPYLLRTPRLPVPGNLRPTPRPGSRLHAGLTKGLPENMGDHALQRGSWTVRAGGFIR